MRATTVRPTGVERTFGADEIIVTKTDPRGVLTYANEVFLRTSALTEEEAIGALGHPRQARGDLRVRRQHGLGRRPLLGLRARHPVVLGRRPAGRLPLQPAAPRAFLLDNVDAFVREAGAASAAAAEGRFHRRILTRGLQGAFWSAAEQISASIVAMSLTAARVAEAASARVALADELESAVLTVSEQVATAATEMGASTNSRHRRRGRRRQRARHGRPVPARRGAPLRGQPLRQHGPPELTPQPAR